MKVKSILAKALVFVLAATISLAAVCSAAAASGIKIAVDTVTAEAGKEVTVPIRVTENTGLGGFKGVLTYDTEILTLKTVEKADLIKDGLLASKEENGTVTFSFANVDRIVGTGVMVNVVFTVSGQAKDGSYDLSLEMPEMYDYDEEKKPVSVPVSVTNGAIRIGKGSSSASQESPDPQPSDSEPVGPIDPSSDDSNGSNNETSDDSANTSSNGDTPAKTGDSSLMIGLAVVLMLSAGAGLILYRQRTGSKS